MKFLVFWLYKNLLIKCIQFLLIQFSFVFNEKIQKIIIEKNQPLPHFQKNKNQLLFWIHAASGEFEYARPVIRELKKRKPECVILVTYSSVSAKSMIQKTVGVDMNCIVPWENPAKLQEFISHFKPNYLFIARTDAWPLMIDQCFQNKIPIYMFSATFADESLRLKFPTKYLTQKTYEQMSHVYCVSHQDQQNILQISQQIQTSVIGDTRFDQVIERIRNAQPTVKIKDESKLTIIAGSTWPEDEKILIPSLCELIKTKKVQLIIAPHEVDEAHLSEIENILLLDQLNSVRYSQTKNDTTDKVIIIDSIGILAEIYTQGDVAFVGGSFKKQVHSVMEPLAAGLLTIVGPFYRNNREAIEFSEIQVTDHLSTVHVIENKHDLESTIHFLLEVNNRSELKQKIHNFVLQRTGATEKLIESLFS